MKKLLFLFIIVFNLCLTSCTPDNPTTTNNQTTTICPQPSLQFKGNGILYVCNAVADSRLGWVGYPSINKNTSSGNSYNLLFCNKKDLSGGLDMFIWTVNYPVTQNTVNGCINFGPNINSLSTGTYQNIDMVFEFLNLNNHYETNPNALSLIITSVNNGLASGTFSGSLPGGTGTVNNGPQMNITDGVFSNIPVFE